MHALIAQLRSALAPVFGADELPAVVKAVVCEVLGFSESDYYLRTPVTLDDSRRQLLDSTVERLLRREPLQHILGYELFGGQRFAVGPQVLIPRPETAELMQHVVEQERALPYSSERRRLLDVGTGSGCIAVSLALRLPSADVYACDVSADALATARANAADAEAFVRFFPFDLLASSPSPQGAPYHVIVSNPPYIRQCERSMMDERVSRYEPSLALFVPDHDPLLFYRALARLGNTGALVPGGTVWVEINALFGTETCHLFSLYGYEAVTLHTDCYSLPRFVSARKPNSQH